MYEELLAKAKEAEDEKELIEMAEKEGIALTEKAASSLFKRLHSPDGELPDDELSNIAGGGCTSSSTPSFSGTWVSGYELSSSCPVCHNNCWAEAYYIGSGPRNYLCAVCSAKSRYNLSSAPSVVPVTEEAGHPNTKSRRRVWVE